MDSFQIIESKDAFLFKDEIGSTTTSWIRQYIDTIAMFYRFTCCIDQIVEVIIIFANSAENIGFAHNLIL